MTTHYIPAYAEVWGTRVRACCGDYVFYESHASEPSCPRCKGLISEEDQQREGKNTVSVAEVVERH